MLSFLKQFQRIIPETQIEMESKVKQAIEKYIQTDTESDQWKKVDFQIQSLKFKVVRECMAMTGLRVTNVDLSNIIDSRSLVDCLIERSNLKQAHGTSSLQTLIDPIQTLFESKLHDFPDNVYFLGEPTAAARRRHILEARKQKIYESRL